MFWLQVGFHSGPGDAQVPQNQRLIEQPCDPAHGLAYKLCSLFGPITVMVPCYADVDFDPIVVIETH